MGFRLPPPRPPRRHDVRSGTRRVSSRLELCPSAQVVALILAPSPLPPVFLPSSSRLPPVFLPSLSPRSSLARSPARPSVPLTRLAVRCILSACCTLPAVQMTCFGRPEARGLSQPMPRPPVRAAAFFPRLHNSPPFSASLVLLTIYLYTGTYKSSQPPSDQPLAAGPAERTEQRQPQARMLRRQSAPEIRSDGTIPPADILSNK